MQSTLNQIDLTKINSSGGIPNSSSIDDFEDSGIKKSKSHVQYLIDPMVKIGLIAKQPYSYRIGIGSFLSIFSPDEISVVCWVAHFLGLEFIFLRRLVTLLMKKSKMNHDRK